MRNEMRVGDKVRFWLRKDALTEGHALCGTAEIVAMPRTERGWWPYICMIDHPTLGRHPIDLFEAMAWIPKPMWKRAWDRYQQFRRRPRRLFSRKDRIEIAWAAILGFTFVMLLALSPAPAAEIELENPVVTYRLMVCEEKARFCQVRPLGVMFKATCEARRILEPLPKPRGGFFVHTDCDPLEDRPA